MQLPSRGRSSCPAACSRVELRCPFAGATVAIEMDPSSLPAGSRRRFHELKSILDVMPVMLRNPARIEAFLFLYFVALFVEAIIEREIRRRMKADGIRSLPLYPEDRKCTAPTAARVFALFADIRRHGLVDPDGQVLRWLYDDLSSTHRAVLRLLSIPTAKYFADGRGAA